jgi:hypothetical protein
MNFYNTNNMKFRITTITIFKYMTQFDKEGILRFYT